MPVKGNGRMMLPTFKYKGYESELYYSKEDKCFWGRVGNTPDLILYEGETIEEAGENFKKAVDEYIEFCNNPKKGVEK